MEEKILNWFENSVFNQGEYAENKIRQIELMNIKKLENIEKNKELKL